MITHKILLFITLIALIGTPTYGEPLNSQDEDIRKQSIEKIRSEVKRRDVPIKFYGLVVDQHGERVENAEIEFGLHQYDQVRIHANKTLKYLSDKNGKIKLSGIVGNALYVRDIKKQGYSFNKQANLQTSFKYWAHFERDIFVPDVNKPVVLVLRQKNYPTFTLKTEIHGGLYYKEKYFISIKNGKVWGKNKKLRFEEDCEIMLSKLNQEKGFRVRFTVQGQEAGIQQTDSSTFTAPEQGYKNILNLEITDSLKTYYFFLKHNDGLYSRIQSRFAPHESVVKVSMDFWINPYGERNLEPNSDIPYPLYKRLKKETRAAFKEGKLPPKHNLKAEILSGSE